MSSPSFVFEYEYKKQDYEHTIFYSFLKYSEYITCCFRITCSLFFKLLFFTFVRLLDIMTSKGNERTTHYIIIKYI